MEETSQNKLIKQTFAALKHRNFRLFWFGQAVSLIGTWMQNVAQDWLVLELTKSAFWLGVVSALQFLPMLLFSLFAGTFIDRLPKKRVLLFTQTAASILAFSLAIDTQLHTVTLWHVLIIATLLGSINTLDMPTRQAFIIELVGKEDLMNAIILNSSIFNAARILGPSVAGLVIARLGMTLCFYLNAFSFIPVIAGIAMIRLANQSEIPLQSAEKPGIWLEIKEGLRYVVRTPVILGAIVLLAAINTFAMNLNVLIPLYARNVFKIGAQGYGLLMAAMGVGALTASIILATRSHRGEPKARALVLYAAAFCFFQLLMVPIKTHLLAYLLLSLIGFTMIAYTTTTNSLIQINTPDNLRGRVMSIYTLVFAGLTPIGSFLSGSAAEVWGAPATFGIGAIISLGFIIMLIFRYPAIFGIGIKRAS